MPSYKLTYFNLRARAELTRQLFAQAGVKYEDVRVEFTDWPTLKPKTPFGTLPILEVDGNITVPESLAIARYVARATGQYGKNAEEAALIDAVVYALHDVFQVLAKVHFAQDAEKATAKKNFVEALQKTVNNLEKMLGAQKGGHGFFVGDKPTMADIYLHCLFETVLHVDAKALDCSSKLKALYEKVRALPRIKAWVASRPKSDI